MVSKLKHSEFKRIKHQAATYPRLLITAQFACFHTTHAGYLYKILVNKKTKDAFQK